jgi:thiamine biosynthesis lipoprotein
MGAPCSIRLHASDRQAAAVLFRQIEADVATLEQRYSLYRPDSLLNRVNASAHSRNGVVLDEEMSGLMDYAEACWRQSDGLFDVTSGSLRSLWNFGQRPDGRGPKPITRLPDAQQVASLLACVGWDKLSWNRPVLRFHVPGMALDFGGIVKEYAADRAATLCHQQGLSSALINFGGDIRVAGPQANGSPWDIGIIHPRRPDALMAQLELSSGALTTSGDYERCIVIDGRCYSHLLDPRTGWPVEGLVSVSVAAPQALVAGSASTIAMLRGRDGPAWLRGLGLSALWMDDLETVHTWHR